MSSIDFDNLEPVEGEVIRVSRSSRVGVIALSSVLLLASLGLVAWTRHEEGVPIKLIVVVVASLIGLVAGLVSLTMEFALVLGADRLQNLRNDKVMGQVPYRNIADISISEKDGAASLVITLVDRQDEDTFWERKRAGWYEVSRSAWGCDVFITPDSSVPISVIYETIQARRGSQPKPG